MGRGNRYSLGVCAEHVTAGSSTNAKDSQTEGNGAMSEDTDTIKDSSKELVGYAS